MSKRCHFLWDRMFQSIFLCGHLNASRMHSKQPIAPQQGPALSRIATELFIVSLSNLFTGAPPTIAQRPQNVTMVAGPDNHATLTCGVDGKPDPVISWLFSKSMVIQ